MCLGVPAVVIDVNEDSSIIKVDYGDGVVREALLGISDEKIVKGDIVMVHAGVVISRLSIEGLYEQIEFMKQLLTDIEDDRALEGLRQFYQNIIQLAKRLGAK